MKLNRPVRKPDANKRDAAIPNWAWYGLSVSAID